MESGHDHPIHEPRLDGILLVCAYGLVGRVDREEEADGGAAGVCRAISIRMPSAYVINAEV